MNKVKDLLDAETIKRLQALKTKLKPKRSKAVAQ